MLISIILYYTVSYLYTTFFSTLVLFLVILAIFFMHFYFAHITLEQEKIIASSIQYDDNEKLKSQTKEKNEIKRAAKKCQRRKNSSVKL